MSFEALRRCRPVQATPAQKAVLMCIADRANDEGEAWPSIPGICEWTCLGRRAVIEALKHLEAAGLITVVKAMGKNNRCSLCFERIDSCALMGQDRFATRTRPAGGPVRETDHTRPADGPPPVRETDHTRPADGPPPVRETDYTRPADGPPPVRETDYTRPADGPEASVSIIQATESTSSSAKVDDCPHQEIVAAFGAALPLAIQVRQWTPTRQALLRARWREDAERQSVEWWRNFFLWVAQSKFLTGQVRRRDERRDFRLSLEWLLKLENFVKVSEGRYHDGAKQPMDDRRPAWAISAGFANRFEAENAGCFEHNHHRYAQGLLLEAA